MKEKRKNEMQLLKDLQEQHPSQPDLILYLAAEKNLPIIVHHLITTEELEATSFHGEEELTALMIATQKNHLEIVQIFLHHGVDVCVTNEDRKTALIIAAEEGHVQILKALLQHQQHTDEDKQSAISLAIKEGHIPVISALLDEKVDINSKTSEQWTLLMLACNFGQIAVANFLILKGADINAKSERHHTALMLASQKGHIDIVDYLLSGDVDIDAQNAYGHSALMLASAAGQIVIVKMLLKDTLNLVQTLEARAHNGDNALICAARNGHGRILTLFLQIGANANVANGEGETALMVAIKNDHFSSVKLLLPFSETQNTEILQIAAEKNNLNMVNLLIGSGIPITNAALRIAVKKHNFEITKTLLENGANASILFNNRISLVAFAEECGNSQMVQLLAKHGANSFASNLRSSSPLTESGGRGF